MVLVNLRLTFHAYFLDNNSGIKTLSLSNPPCQNSLLSTLHHLFCFPAMLFQKTKNNLTIPQSKRVHRYTEGNRTRDGSLKQKERCHKRRRKTGHIQQAHETLSQFSICRLRITTVTSNYFDAATKPINAILWCITQNISGKYKEHRETAVTNTTLLHSQ